MNDNEKFLKEHIKYLNMKAVCEQAKISYVTYKNYNSGIQNMSNKKIDELVNTIKEIFKEEVKMLTYEENHAREETLIFEVEYLSLNKDNTVNQSYNEGTYYFENYESAKECFDKKERAVQGNLIYTYFLNKYNKEFDSWDLIEEK